jgi:hypothetical protein
MTQSNSYAIDPDGIDPQVDGFRSERWGIAAVLASGADAFDAIEISGCTADDDFVEVLTDPDGVPSFYSVYLHQVEGGVVCIGDFATAERARTYAGQFRDAFGWPITVDRT